MTNQIPDGARRIMVIGCPGAGKSTLSRALAASAGLPLFHLDQFNWRSGWVEAPASDYDAALADVLKTDSWIIDGNYTSSIAPRLMHADLVIWLDLPARVCLWRIVRRVVASYGKARPDMPDGCPERFDLEFLMFVATFRARVRPKTLRLMATYAGRVVHLTDVRSADALLATVRSRT